MRSKSLVQERLEASRNRLEVLSREVESNRMSPKDVSKGLRQIGTYLESVQTMVKKDTNVKFGQQINQRLEGGMNRLTTTIDALDGTGITNKQLKDSLGQVNRTFESIQEFVDLEIEDLG